MVNEMRKGTGNYGFDAARGEYVDSMEAGTIDPTKVGGTPNAARVGWARSALRRAEALFSKRQSWARCEKERAGALRIEHGPGAPCPVLIARPLIPAAINTEKQ